MKKKLFVKALLFLVFTMIFGQAGNQEYENSRMAFGAEKYEEAYNYYLFSAKKGNMDAMIGVAMLYVYGKGRVKCFLSQFYFILGKSINYAFLFLQIFFFPFADADNSFSTSERYFSKKIFSKPIGNSYSFSRWLWRDSA